MSSHFIVCVFAREHKTQHFMCSRAGKCWATQKSSSPVRDVKTKSMRLEFDSLLLICLFSWVFQNNIWKYYSAFITAKRLISNKNSVFWDLLHNFESNESEKNPVALNDVFMFSCLFLLRPHSHTFSHICRSTETAKFCYENLFMSHVWVKLRKN